MPLVETEVRRGCRLQEFSKGFRKAVCKDKDCPACHAKPPTLPPIVVKNLNSSLCKVNILYTNEEKLITRNKKPKGTQAAAKEGATAAKELNKSQH